MTLSLDHIVIAVRDLEQSIHDYEQIGFTVVRGGIHANRATRNALVIFQDGTYLELLSHTSEIPLPSLIDFSPMLDGKEGIAGFAMRTDDLDSETARMRRLGFDVGEPVVGERRRIDGTLVQWKLALLNETFRPFFIQDITPRKLRIPGDPALTTHKNNAIGMQGIALVVHNLETARERYISLLGLSSSTQNTQSQNFNGLSFKTPASYTRIDALIDDSGIHTEEMFAIELLHEHMPSSHFTLDQTHGVRFEQFALS